MKRVAGLILLVCSGSFGIAQQQCDTAAYPVSTPTARFTDHGDGTLTDTASGKTWMRCALGQHWTGSRCSGEPQAFTWQAAQDAAGALNAGGGFAHKTDWRMPHIPELATIVERQCANPRVNLTLFPDTPAAYFWTATARGGPDSQEKAYRLSFGPEGAGPANKDGLYYARLMRKDKAPPAAGAASSVK